MAKRQTNDPEQSSKTAIIVLAAGGIVVAALVGWALTRSVEPALPAPTPAAATAPATASAPMGVEPQPNSSVPSDESWFTEDAHRKVPRMAVEDLRAKANRGEVTIIDVRDRAAYEAAHIPGSIHIPLAQMQSQLDLIPKSKPIVTYCT